MNYCNYCGVELDDKISICPLCGLSVGENPPKDHPLESKPFVTEHKIKNQIKHLSGAQKRLLFWETSAIILISGIIATIFINFIVDHNITWAKYNFVASLSVLANISIFTFLLNRRFLLVLGSFLSNALLLFFIDFLSSNSGWGTALGIPILASLYVLIIVVLWLINISNRQGFNIIAIIVIAIGILLICVEAFISLYFTNTVNFNWSTIACSCLLPISAILFFVHYRLKAGIDLQRFFHI